MKIRINFAQIHSKISQLSRDQIKWNFQFMNYFYVFFLHANFESAHFCLWVQNRFFLGPDKHPRADGLGFSVERTKWARSKNHDPSWGNAEAWDWNLWLERSESHKLAKARGCLSGPRKNILSCKQSRGLFPLQNCLKICSSDRPFWPRPSKSSKKEREKALSREARTS